MSGSSGCARRRCVPGAAPRAGGRRGKPRLTAGEPDPGRHTRPRLPGSRLSMPISSAARGLTRQNNDRACAHRQVRAWTATVILDTERLQLELDRRGLTKDAFARAAGVSKNTITAAANGRQISPRTARQLVRTLVSIPPMHMVDELLADPVGGPPHDANRREATRLREA
jgi:DNA-binding XRE family transcriptional regulator